MPDLKVKVKKFKPIRLAYIEHRGPYDKIPFEQYYENLFGWAKEAGAKPGFRPVGIYPTSPKDTPPKNLIAQIGIPIRADVGGTKDIKIKEVPAMTTAQAKFKGPSDEIEATYDVMTRWVIDNGYEIIGPSMEVYTGKPRIKEGKMHLKYVIHMPVKKK